MSDIFVLIEVTKYFVPIHCESFKNKLEYTISIPFGFIRFRYINQPYILKVVENLKGYDMSKRESLYHYDPKLIFQN